MIQLLHEKYPDRRYVGLDPTPEMIHVAQTKQLSNTEFLVGDSENLPFAEASFDAVMKVYKSAEFISMAEKAGFTVLTMEKQKGFRAHLVARK